MPDRILRESICCSDTLDQLSPFEETVFYRLTVNCDDYGRVDARPRFLKSRLFATKRGVTEEAVADAVRRMAEVGLVRLYLAEGRQYLLFPKWEKHQRIRAKRSRYPAPEGGEEERDGSGRSAGARGAGAEHWNGYPIV